ncbi:SemiSWEET transporter [Kordiimonas pumila]|uniref:SemiSWEET transporter n=1 Tax=Kordiimonas pumila TaxID=2161677 RepID=A0ABV7D1F2_9PROT|nr:SemiSWEET transporter [Kordiimonas pumila]
MALHIDTLGYGAAFLTTISFIPQALKVWREDNTSAISLGMYSLFVMGILLWLVYGAYIANYPITVANGITLCLAVSILYKKLQHVRAGRKL